MDNGISGKRALSCRRNFREEGSGNRLLTLEWDSDQHRRKAVLERSGKCI
jgi:hypothetical protein